MFHVVGRHSTFNGRRSRSVFLACALAPAALFFVVKGDASPLAEPSSIEAVAAQAPLVIDEPESCCIQVVASSAMAPEAGRTVAEAMERPAAGSQAASRWRVVSRTLPAGHAPEEGLQVKTILTSRSISALFPAISNIGGVRPDSLRWHPNGLALDVMVPDPTSEAGIALGDAIVAYVLENSHRFGIQDAIWRGVYYTPSGARPGGYGHYDHVHITTTGGGYPSGNELYLR